MKFFIFLIYLFNFTNSFFTPQIKTSSGKKLIIKGNGPPVLFSTGLYGSMPGFFYNNLINELKKNNTIVTIDGFTPIVENTIEEVCNALRVNKIGYIGHSSFNPESLNNNYITSALLIDPINIPSINFNGIGNKPTVLRYPTKIIKAKKLYYGKKILPDWQNPNFQGNYTEEYYEHVGHPDILDNLWANIAKSLGLWEMAEGEKMKYEDWSYSMKNSVPRIRKEYIKYVAKSFNTND
tara:strand:- start:739 stop:1449 length:711 start_codon:yes stop_codon:yes gene_type:complete